ncbi:carbohydrate ABC transporter permease [Kribbella sp. CA-294648]|uniref:carbohydrate ABC transporter permease n=1 Tax=Kribbella sp. CA-294648 TaxID=3239948 RepID=UPI003D8A1203
MVKAESASRPRRFGSWVRSDLAVGPALIAPAVILVGVFVLWPIARAVYLTFFDYSFLADRSAFIGLTNYLEWARDPRMWHSLWISVKFFMLYVPTSMAIALLIAVLIDRLANAHFASIYRTIFYFPVVLPAAIVFQMWIWIYEPTLGFMTLTGEAVGADTSLNWLGEPRTALGALAIMNVWRHLGETVIFFLIGLANIPKENLEAARLDGASEVKIVTRIIIPLLAPMIFLVFVLRLKVLELVAEPLFMTQGGPIGSTMTYGLQAYELFHQEDRIGYANTWFVLMAGLAVAAAAFAGKRMRQFQN